jgi:hypothetical protein
VPKYPCQSLMTASFPFRQAIGGRPALGRFHHVDTPWQPYAGRGPTGQVHEGLKSTPMPHSPSLAPLLLSLALSTPMRTNRAAIAAERFPAAVRARHCTTSHYTTSTAPPPPHAPCRPPLWSNRARVRAHCRLLPARSSPVHRRPHGPPRPALLSALPSHLALVPPSPSPVDASVMTLSGSVFPSRWNTAAHRRAMATANARTWPRSSTSPRSSLVASLGPPRLQGADAPLSWPSSGRSSSAHHRAPPPSRHRHGRCS